MGTSPVANQYTTGAAKPGQKRYTAKVNKKNNYYDYVDVFRPLEWQIPALNCKDRVMLLTGSAGGGKSRCAAQKIHAFCLTYPGSQAVILRKVSTAMYNSTIAFIEKSVMGRYLAKGIVRHNKTEKKFVYENGSVISWGGMRDDSQKENWRSLGQEGGADIIWMEEANQFDETDFNEMIARLRGTAADWRQLILTTNPDSPLHWIYTRLIQGKEATTFYSSALDNTYNPEDYREGLLTLTGLDGDRLRDGKWVAAGGLVIDRWVDYLDEVSDHGGNVTNNADYIPGGGEVVWWIDDGYAGEIDQSTGNFKPGSHPRAFLLAQLRANGQMAVFAEHYAIQTTEPDHIEEVVGMCRRHGWPRPTRIIYDKAAAALGGHLKTELRSHWNIGSDKIDYNAVPVIEGNKEVNTRSAADKNGWRQIICHPRCRYLRLEMLSYKNNPKTSRPIKDFDHGPDALRIGVWDVLHGDAVESDAAGPEEVDIMDEIVENEGVLIFEDGDTSIAVLL